jgi:hypothetical protein
LFGIKWWDDFNVELKKKHGRKGEMEIKKNTAE